MLGREEIRTRCSRSSAGTDRACRACQVEPHGTLSAVHCLLRGNAGSQEASGIPRQDALSDGPISSHRSVVCLENRKRAVPHDCQLAGEGSVVVDRARTSRVRKAPDALEGKIMLRGWNGFASAVTGWVPLRRVERSLAARHQRPGIVQVAFTNMLC